MKSLEVYAYGRLQRSYQNLSQERLDELLDEWEEPGCAIDCDEEENNWTIYSPPDDRREPKYNRGRRWDEKTENASCGLVGEGRSNLLR